MKGSQRPILPRQHHRIVNSLRPVPVVLLSIQRILVLDPIPRLPQFLLRYESQEVEQFLPARRQILRQIFALFVAHAPRAQISFHVIDRGLQRLRGLLTRGRRLHERLGIDVRAEVGDLIQQSVILLHETQRQFHFRFERRLVGGTVDETFLLDRRLLDATDEVEGFAHGVGIGGVGVCEEVSSADEIGEERRGGGGGRGA
mmetsp:Transcript_8971/g.19025  ORF Transcript_8971/g.19025 Transcript_8971/m.19025 type:complete len:201 (+) Transcript_8971:230-832(+)